MHMNEEDNEVLHVIMDALGVIGSQLSAADHLSDYDPWRVIADKELEIKRKIAMLSESFSGTHGDLLVRLASPKGLHRVWGNLKEEVAHIVEKFRQG